MENIDHEEIEIRKYHEENRKGCAWKKFSCNCKIHWLKFFRRSENQSHQSSERWKRPHPDLSLADVLTYINHATKWDHKKAERTERRRSRQRRSRYTNGKTTKWSSLHTTCRVLNKLLLVLCPGGTSLIA